MNTTGSDQRRTRASREQVRILEEAFNVNTQPNAKTRETLSKRLGMTERSVQIWFQNRRAKIKLGQRKIHMALKEEALRQHCMAAYSGRPTVLPPPPPRAHHASHTAPLPDSQTFHSPYIGFNSSCNTPNPQLQEHDQTQFPCTLLTIGNWKRMPVGLDDLMCCYGLESHHMAWIISDHQSRFKIQFPFSSISKIELGFVDPVYAELAFELISPPSFSILINNSEWIPCGDFTEEAMASQVLRHTLIGEAQEMRVQLLKLIEAVHPLSQKTIIKPSSSSAPSQQFPFVDPAILSAPTSQFQEHPYIPPYSQQQVTQNSSPTILPLLNHITTDTKQPPISSWSASSSAASLHNLL